MTCTIALKMASPRCNRAGHPLLHSMFTTSVLFAQVVQPEAGVKFLAARRADQQRALKLIQDDPQLR